RFAKTALVICTAALAIIGVGWTDSSELGRGALLAAAILVPLPIAALVRRNGCLDAFLRTFAVSTAASLVFGLAARGLEFSRMVDSTDSHTANPNSVGIQAALAALFLLIAFPRWKKAAAYPYAVVCVFLVISAILTASRTAFLALIAALAIWLMLLGR